MPKLHKVNESVRKYFGINLFVSFSLFVFAPLELYLANYADFFFSLKVVIPYTLICCLCAIVFLMLMDCICGHGKWYEWGKGILCAISLAMYIQGNFLPANYGLMDGTPIDWEKGFSVVYRMTNITAWVLIIIICIIIFIKKFNVVQVISACLVLTQLVTLSVLVLNYQPKIQISSTNEGKLELSNNHNIIVVVADGFDGGFFEKALKDCPQIAEEFDGFTYYKNTVGTSLYTDESISTLLTGNQLEISTSYKEASQKAYEESSLYTLLKQNDYRVSIYEQGSRFLDLSLLDVADNVVNTSAGIKSKAGFCKMIYQLVAFKYMPHELKKNYWMSTTDFEKMKATDYYTWDNLAFYNSLQEGITVQEDNQNCYQIFHIQGPHEPISMDAEVNPLEKSIQMADEQYEEGQYQQTLGTIKIFSTLIKKLKDAGIYNNSTVIFTADHGWDVRPWPLLLIKNENELGVLNVSDVPVSMVEDYLPTLEAIILQDEDSPNAIFNLSPDMERARPFYTYNINSSTLRSYNERQRWELYSNDIENRQDWSLADVEKHLAPYRLGTPLLFKKDGNVADYVGVGFSHLGDTYTWTNGTKAELFFYLEGDYNDLLLSMEYFTYHGEQQVSVYANDTLVTNYIANGEEAKEIMIPKEYIDKAELILRFELPNASSPKDNGESEDARNLALAMKKVVISATN